MFQTTLTVVINTDKPIDTEDKKLEIAQNLVYAIQRGSEELKFNNYSVKSGEVIVPKVGKAGSF
jgi:hypothetical protein